MNQFGYVELTHMKNDLPYRVMLPLGTPWKDALEAILDISQEIADHIKTLEQMEKEKEESPEEPAPAA